jgi:predicted RND superfamily exporter protein
MMDATLADGEKTILTALFVILLLLLLDFSNRNWLYKLLYIVTGFAVISCGVAGLFPLIFVFIYYLPLLFIDPRGMSYTLMALVPIVFGLIWMLGLMGVIGMKYNYMNMMALPILLGIGIDDGVHMIHRYLQSKKREMPRILTWVGKAILLTTLTTMIGFGSVGFYTHVGMASFGIVLFMGVGACFIITLFILAPFLQIRENFMLKRESAKKGVK